MSNSHEFDRRQFARGLLAAAAVTGSMSNASRVNGQDKTPPPESVDATKPENVARPNEAVPQELALLNVLMQRYPSDQYDRMAIRGIFADLRGDVARGEILSQFPLLNSDEPGAIFRPFRSGD